VLPREFGSDVSAAQTARTKLPPGEGHVVRVEIVERMKRSKVDARTAL
jgi:hypothetical protein